MTSHEDRRYGYLRALWSRTASSSSVANYRLKEWEHLCKALARINIATELLPNRHAVRSCVSGCGDKVDELLKEVDDAGAGRGSNNSPPPRGTYCGAAAALLVALLNATEEDEGATPPPKEVGVVSKERLLDAAAAICEQRFLPSARHVEAARSASGKPPRCAAAQQLQSLSGHGLQLVRPMQRKKLCATGEAYALTDAGRARAVQLRRHGEAAAAAPLHSAGRVGPSERSVVLLLVDEREGGGDKHHLRALCEALARRHARFETRVLPRGCGDYQFVRADGASGREVVLPRILERKSYADLAASMMDGRWEAQQAAMAAKDASDFGGAATLEYILEGSLGAEIHRPCARCLGLGGAAATGSNRGGGKAAAKRARATKATDANGAPKRPRRETGAAKRPKKPEQFREHPLPGERTCNYAFLVVLDRERCRREAAAGGAGDGASVDPNTVALSKEELMRLANDTSDGALTHVDVYDGHAVAQNAAAGSFAYDGWAGVQSGLIKRAAPWLPLLREQRNKRTAGGGATFSLTMPAGVAAARRLHSEAELAGHCTCGLVPKAKIGQPPMITNDKGERERGGALGLIADRAPIMPTLMSAEAYANYAPWERQMISWEESEARHEQKLEEWKEAYARWEAGAPPAAATATTTAAAAAVASSCDASPRRSQASAAPSSRGHHQNVDGGGTGRGRGASASSAASPGAFGSSNQRLKQSPLFDYAVCSRNGSAPGSAASAGRAAGAASSASGASASASCAPRVATHPPRALASVMEGVEVVDLDDSASNGDDDTGGARPLAARIAARFPSSVAAAAARPASSRVPNDADADDADPALAEDVDSDATLEDEPRGDQRANGTSAAMDIASSDDVDDGASSQHHADDGGHARNERRRQLLSACFAPVAEDWDAASDDAAGESEEGRDDEKLPQQQPRTAAAATAPPSAAAITTGAANEPIVLEDSPEPARPPATGSSWDQVLREAAPPPPNATDGEYEGMYGGGDPDDNDGAFDYGGASAPPDVGSWEDDSALYHDDEADGGGSAGASPRVGGGTDDTDGADDDTGAATDGGGTDADVVPAINDDDDDHGGADSADGTAAAATGDDSTLVSSAHQGSSHAPATTASSATTSSATASSATASSTEEAVWEVLLEGKFVPYRAEQQLLEAAFRRGDVALPIRNGTREVTLRQPHVQRAATGHAPCKERQVRRRVLSSADNTASAAAAAAAGASGSNSSEEGASLQAAATQGPAGLQRHPDGTKVRVRWATFADEPWVHYTVLSSCTFEDAGETEVQHCVVQNATGTTDDRAVLPEREWVNLAEAAQCERIA